MQNVWAGGGSGTEYIWQLPHGCDLYPCHQFVGNEKFLLGNVDTGNCKYTETRDEFISFAMYMQKKHARTALQDFTAGGGCSAKCL